MSSFGIEDLQGRERIVGAAIAPGASASDVLTADGAGGASWQAGGGSQPGAMRLIAVPISHTLGANVFQPIHTPAVGDTVIPSQGFFLITTPWDGTTPGGYVVFEGDDLGNAIAGDVDLTVAAISEAPNLLFGSPPYQSTPARILTTTRIGFLFNDGNGGDPGSTAGAGIVYLAVCTPASS